MPVDAAVRVEGEILTGGSAAQEKSDEGTAAGAGAAGRPPPRSRARHAARMTGGPVPLLPCWVWHGPGSALDGRVGGCGARPVPALPPASLPSPSTRPPPPRLPPPPPCFYPGLDPADASDPKRARAAPAAAATTTRAISSTPVPVDHAALFSKEGASRRLAGLREIVAAHAGKPGVVGLHGGFPPPDAFPFVRLTATLKDGTVVDVSDPAKVRG